MDAEVERIARRIAAQYPKRGEVAFERQRGWRPQSWEVVVIRAKEILAGK